MLFRSDYYYVLGYSEKQRKVINFRVDRIALRPDILAKDIIPMPDDFDIENFTKEVFFMFSGEKVLVDLRCDNSLMKTMVDRFGEDVTDQYQTGRSAYLRLGQLFMRLFAGLL